MKLVSVSIENYRSIAKARKIRLGPLSVLIGPNNEGKSNILRALVTAMRVLTAQRRSPDPDARFLARRAYTWEQDFPVPLQGAQPSGQSLITLEFSLSPQELVEFQSEIRSTLNGTLPLRIAMGPRGDYKITVRKPGPGAQVLSGKAPAIASFVAKRLDFEYIPAVRTAESAQQIVEGMVGRELMRLEINPEYQKALTKIASLQEPLLLCIRSANPCRQVPA